MADSTDNYRPVVSNDQQHERSRSPRRGRSRSPGRLGRRRSFSPRSRSRGDRGESRDDHRRNRDRSPMMQQPGPSTGNSGPGGNYGGSGPNRSHDDGRPSRDSMINNMRDSSQQERRVYVGNLAYDVKWHHLKDFMRQSGEVLFADVLLLPNGMSKGCGIVEYATKEQAQNAVQALSNKNLMGRLIYVREDREPEPRFLNAAGNARGGGFGGGMSQGGFSGGYNMGGPPSTQGRQIYVSNLSYNVGWQDLKDLFRQAAQNGNVLRADIQSGPDGRPKGSGIVVFESPDDARNAIQQFNGYEWQGRIIEVREDRYAGNNMGFGGRGGFQGGRGGFNNFGPPRGGFMSRGGFGGGFSGRGGFQGGAGHHSGGFDNAGPPPSAPPNPFTDFATAGSEPSDTIYVRNLPWSTSNEDLVDLFVTIGKVEQAEIQYEPSGRSRGTGVVRFDSVDNAETAISKFQGYQYGGRALSLSFVKYINQNQGNMPPSANAPPSGNMMGGGGPMETDHHGGMTQEQIM
ncbi:putative RNA-binding protein [Ceratocystis fimbriata CBS 114723]|uniref:Putative RNA-binding protein n=1 Tax=Ceratocystis fimbriata CBS 114723 TaxID=1035309 RepID=A0A2C5X8C3_9PEZI|nr:putative RNA-binding protein [Ceratocystis fimbriata CBS 114723]